MPRVHDAHDKHPPLRTHLADEDATLNFGRRLASVMPARLNILLSGDLGAGKTTLTRGLLRGLDYTGRVKSPTYTLVESYKDSRIIVYHFDFYRFTHAEEFLEAGLDEYFQGPGLRLVEWPDRADPYLPPADLAIRLRIADDGGRDAELHALTPEGRTCVDHLLASRPA